MAFELLIALQVTDEETYQKYREAMNPILKDHGGGFGYDFRVSDVLQSETDAPINRVFTIHFPDEEKRKQFFSNTEYQQVRKAYYEPSVGATTIISSYEK